MLLCESSPRLLKCLLQFKSCLFTVELVCPSQVQQSSTGGLFLQQIWPTNTHLLSLSIHPPSEFSPIPEEQVCYLTPVSVRWNERKAALERGLVLRELWSRCYLGKVCEVLSLPHPLAGCQEMCFILFLKKKFW